MISAPLLGFLPPSPPPSLAAYVPLVLVLCRYVVYSPPQFPDDPVDGGPAVFGSLESFSDGLAPPSSLTRWLALLSLHMIPPTVAVGGGRASRSRGSAVFFPICSAAYGRVSVRSRRPAQDAFCLPNFMEDALALQPAVGM